MMDFPKEIRWRYLARLWYNDSMEESKITLELTAEQRKALDAGNGVVQGSSFVLMRTDVVLDFFGYTKDELQRQLQPGLDQIESGDVAEWNLQDFLTKMHKGHAANTK